MGRNYGLTETKVYYSEQDFKDGCWFNFIFGLGSGIGFIILSELAFAWYKGWIL